MKQAPDFDFLPLQNSNVPLYMQVYNYYKALITKGKLPPATKLPSIRRCAEALSAARPPKPPICSFAPTAMCFRARKAAIM